MRRTLNGRLYAGLIATWVWLTALPVMAAETEAQLLLYRMQAPGEGSTLNRFLVTPSFLRLDHGERDSGYILFDRQAQLIYSVNHKERSILVIDPPSMTEALAAQAPVIEVKSVEPVEAPAVAGVKPQRWLLTAAGRTCREAFVLPGAMSEAVAAYGEYLNVLARQQAVGQAAIPAEFQDACDSAIHVYAPASLLDKGLILKVWNDQNYREELLDFRRDFKVSERDFVLPQGYQRVPMMSGF